MLGQCRTGRTVQDSAATVWGQCINTERMLDWLIRKEKLVVKRQLRYCSGFACKTVYFTPERVSVDYSIAVS